MNTTYELNNIRKDSDLFNNKFAKTSPVVEVFSAMVNGEELSRFGAKADKAVNYIKELGARADNNDYSAVAELNTLRKFAIETPLLQELKLLSVFGPYKNVGYDETIEREIYTHVGEKSRQQAASGDVVFPAIRKESYTVPTFTISGGYAVDYRRVQLGDMSKENEGIAQVCTDIRNKAVLAVMEKVCEAIKNATGVKYLCEDAGLTKTNVDAVLNKIRRYGRPTVLGDYALISQFTPWGGYSGTIGTNTITGISQKVLDELAANGALSMYNGAILSELPNPYNVLSTNADGTDFETMLPTGVGLVIPAGVESPIATWTQGGLTSFTGNDVHTGKVLTRFDLVAACDVAKGLEHRIGLICDSDLSQFEG
jgi:hypothetical protein